MIKYVLTSGVALGIGIGLLVMLLMYATGNIDNTTSVIQFSIISVLAAFFIPDLIKGYKTDKISENGVSVPAKILKVEIRGTSGAMKHPLISIHVKVMPHNMPSYHAITREQTFSPLDLHKLQPGNIVAVMYDPAKPEDVVVNSPDDDSAYELHDDKDSAEFTSSSGSVETPSGVPQEVTITSKSGMNQSTINELKKLSLLQKELLENGREETGVILSAEETGIVVEGVNPLMQFEIEVKPDDTAPFRVKVAAPILRDSMHKYRSGNTVKIKYDPYDRARAVLAGSI